MSVECVQGGMGLWAQYCACLDWTEPKTDVVQDCEKDNDDEDDDEEEDEDEDEDDEDDLVSRCGHDCYEHVGVISRLILSY